MMESDLKHRIKQRIEALGISARKVSIDAGCNPDTLGKVLLGKTKTLRGDHLSRIARVLKVSESWLTTGEDAERMAEEHPTGARYGGIVEAGTFRPTDIFNQEDEIRTIEMPLDPRYDSTRQFAFEVVGDSMTQAHIEEGMWLLAVDSHLWQHLHGELRDGLLVIVARLRNGDPERELTVKRLRVFRDRIELRPESTNPKHQALIYPHNDEDPTHGIIAVVLQASWKFN